MKYDVHLQIQHENHMLPRHQLYINKILNFFPHRTRVPSLQIVPKITSIMAHSKDAIRTHPRSAKNAEINFWACPT